jgi:hypothetical protein
MIWTPVIASAPHEIWAQIIVLYITQEQASQAGGHRSGLREQKLATSYDDDRSWLTSRPEDTASPGRSGMPPSGGDPNPWYFGNEMTIDGCQGWQPSASSANGSASSGKPPASDGRLPPDNPSATSDPSW